MRSKLAVVVSLLFVLAIGGAALAVNTRILNSSPQTGIGRANEVLIPRDAEPGLAPAPPTASFSNVPTAPAPTVSPPRSNDEHSSSERRKLDEAEHEPDD